jgi:hypothetical protein
MILTWAGKQTNCNTHIILLPENINQKHVSVSKDDFIKKGLHHHHYLCPDTKLTDCSKLQLHLNVLLSHRGVTVLL